MRILLIDNFDSFTYNLAQYFGELGAEVLVRRNDAVGLEEIAGLRPGALVISPGPGLPAGAGITLAAIRRFSGRLPILGVCLGHQAIAEAFGGRLVQAPVLVHGKTSKIHHRGEGIFSGLPNPFLATRYHSWLVDVDALPPELEVTATTEDGLVMALRHRRHPTFGVQFHPESILTEHGRSLLENFLQLAVPPQSGNGKSVNKSEEGAVMMQTAIRTVLEGRSLHRGEAQQAMSCLMAGEATPAQIGAFLAALRMKGETPEEIAGFAAAMREKAVPVPTRHRDAVDLCGTGGDGKGTFNISTVAGFVAAGAGVPVAKHGNRSVSSKCGSADVLQALGVEIDLGPEEIGRCLDEVGIAFLFAPRLHPAMKYAIGPRREIGARTVFNILGPICNPAGVRRQLIGVYDRKLLRLLAEVLLRLGSEHVLLVHSAEGLDEISIAGATYAAELRNGEIRELELTPADFGLQPEPLPPAGGDARANAEIALAILRGEQGPGRDIVIANAAAAIYVAGRAASLREAAQIAAASIDSGRALQKLEALREMTASFRRTAEPVLT